jgi:serine/threonine protein kinase
LLRRPIAIKLLHSALSQDESLLRRLRRELRITSQVTHPRIVRTFDIIDIHGAAGIAMALIEGEDLARVLGRRSRIAATESVQMGIAICGALRAAHAVGVVHRDIKPQNILVNREGELFLTDFGLAKCMVEDGSYVTRATESVGTPRYAAPEQMTGQVVDQRADLYSLGAVLYELLTGRPPFSDFEKLDLGVLNLEPKDPQRLNPDIPRELSHVVLKCLAVSPADRYQNADELLAALFGCARQRRSALDSWMETLRIARRFLWLALGIGFLTITCIVAERRTKAVWTTTWHHVTRYISGTTASGSQVPATNSGSQTVAWSTGASRITVVANGRETLMTDAGLAVWNLPGSRVAYSEWTESGLRTSQRLILFDASSGTRGTIFEGPYFIQNVISSTSAEGEPVIVLTVVRCVGAFHGVVAVTLDGGIIMSLEPADLIALEAGRITVARYFSSESRVGGGIRIQAYLIRAKDARSDKRLNKMRPIRRVRPRPVSPPIQKSP